MSLAKLVYDICQSLRESGVHATLKAFHNALVPSTLRSDDPRLVPIRIAFCICLYANPTIFSEWFVAAQDLDTRSAVLEILTRVKEIRKLREDRDTTLRTLIYKKNTYAGVEYTVDLNRKVPPPLLILVLFAEYLGNHKMTEHISVINGIITIDEKYYRQVWEKRCQVFSYDYTNPDQLQPRFFATWTKAWSSAQLKKFYGGIKYLCINEFGRNFFTKHNRHANAGEIMTFLSKKWNGVLPPNTPFWVNDYVSRCSFAPYGYFRCESITQEENPLPEWPTTPLKMAEIDPFYITCCEEVNDVYEFPEPINIYVDDSAITPVKSFTIEESSAQCPLVEYFPPITLPKQTKEMFNVGSLPNPFV